MEDKNIYDISAEMYNRVHEEYNINLYEKVLELRKFEIENFWKRALFFWGTIALIYVGYTKIDNQNPYFIIIPLIGFLFNLIFSLSIRGSKYWQEHYENLATQYEIGMNFILFRHKNTEDFLGNKFIYSKPHRFSVSKLAMLLADLSLIVWLLLWLKSIFEIITFLKFEFSTESNLHLPTIFVLLSHVLLIGYFWYFIKNGKVFHKPNKSNYETYIQMDNQIQAKKAKPRYKTP